MPKQQTPAFTQAITHYPTQFITADSTTYKNIATGGVNDSRIVHITISSTDSNSNVAYFALSNGVATIPIGHCDILTGSGTDGTNTVIAALSADSFLHRKLDNNANPYLELAAGWNLLMKLETAVSGVATIGVLVTLEDY